MVSFQDLKTEDKFNYIIQLSFLILDIPIFLCLLFIKAYYGKFFNSKSEETNSIQKTLRKIFPVIPRDSSRMPLCFCDNILFNPCSF